MMAYLFLQNNLNKTLYNNDGGRCIIQGWLWILFPMWTKCTFLPLLCLWPLSDGFRRPPEHICRNSGFYEQNNIESVNVLPEWRVSQWVALFFFVFCVLHHRSWTSGPENVRNIGVEKRESHLFYCRCTVFLFCLIFLQWWWIIKALDRNSNSSKQPVRKQLSFIFHLYCMLSNQKYHNMLTKCIFNTWKLYF